MGRIAALGLISFVALMAAAPNALAAQQVINSAGPLPNIYLNDNLACQAEHTGDADEEFFGATDLGACGTFLSTGDVSYGPIVPAGDARTEFDPVSQTAVTGSGVVGNPYRVVTVVHAGSTGLDITQTDSYVVGQEAYRTDIAVKNTATSGSPVTATLYHAADCFLQDSDVGNGFHDSTSGGIFCSTNVDNAPADRVEGFVPLSGDSHYYEAGFSSVWDAIDGAGTNFPDSCGCSTLQDNGAGLSWALSVPANSTVTRSLVTAFSPAGVIPDTTPPDTIIDSAAHGTTADPTPTFAFNSTEAGSSFECSIDTGAPSFGACSGPGATHTPAALANGTYTFRVRATDAAANTDPTPVTETFTVLDTTPPDTIIDSGPTGTTNDSTPTFGFHSTEAASTFQCSIDTGTPAFGPCSGPGATHTPGALAAGAYTFRVEATDPGSNPDPSPATRAFTVGLSKPRFGNRANASTVSGVVKVKLPGSGKFVILGEGQSIPIGSIIDARNGRVRIVSADGKTGKTRVAEFFGGIFKLRQGKATRGYTDAQLVGPLSCGNARAGATASKGRRGRHIWGSGKGRHSSTGKNSSGSVRGTEWLVWDRCDGSTWTFAKSGKVLVRDFRSGRKVLLRKGQRYVAKPRGR